MSSSLNANPGPNIDLTALAESLGDQLRGRPRAAIELLQLLIEDGLSSRAAAREAGVTEQVAMLWANSLGLKRSANEVRQVPCRALIDSGQCPMGELPEPAAVERSLVPGG
jgi:hypothetical protein